MNPLIRRRKAAYQRLFPIENGQLVGDAATVLADLAKFCKPNVPPLQRDANGATDAYQTGIRAGRQEVFNRVRAFLHLEDRTAFNLEETDE